MQEKDPKQILKQGNRMSDAKPSEEIDKKQVAVLDLVVMNRLLNDTSLEFMPVLMQILAEESWRRLARMRASIANSDPTSVELEIKSLKSVAATVGAIHLSQLIEEIELALRRSDLSAMIFLSSKIEMSLNEVIINIRLFYQREVIARGAEYLLQ